MLRETKFMERDNSELGYIPHVNMQELKENVSRLEARLSELQTDEDDVDRTTLRAVTALLRNRKNLMEMLQRERFI